MKKRLFFAILFISINIVVWGRLRGDLNGDNQADVSDANKMIDMVLGKADKDVSFADMNIDGNIDVADVNMLIDIVLGVNQTDDEAPVTRTFSVNGVPFTMVSVEGGTFTMGATEEQGTDDPYDDEYPTHEVTLSSFCIGETEVTQELWQAVMGDNPSWFNYQGEATRLPVESVSWNDCQLFIAKLRKLTGKTFRLLTEAEWEYAARGGNKSQGYKYAGGNDLNYVAWYYNEDLGTQPVGLKRANELGLYDMNGNVWEWCYDLKENYSNKAQTDPIGSAEGENRVMRGGSWFSVFWDCRVSTRGCEHPDFRDYRLGLRLAL